MHTFSIRSNGDLITYYINDKIVSRRRFLITAALNNAFGRSFELVLRRGADFPIEGRY